MLDITTGNIIPKQIYWLRLLSTLSPEEVMVMLKPESKWLSFSDIIHSPPDRPIHSRSILRNEIVMEIDSNDWIEVRSGTTQIIDILNQWGAAGHYYLSYSGNRSIHVHVFVDLHTVNIADDTKSIILGQESVNSVVKTYLMTQIARASHTMVDMGLTGKHLIRMEGGFNEKSKKYCTMIHEVPEDKPRYYDIEIPSALPPRLWDLTQFEKEINAFLKVHFQPKGQQIEFHGTGRPFDPEPIKDILKPVYISGYRHFIVLSLSGWLKRHEIPEDKALEVVRALNPHDKTPAKTAGTVYEVYRANPEGKTAGLPYLLKIINEMAVSGKISNKLAQETTGALNRVKKYAVDQKDDDPHVPPHDIPNDLSNSNTHIHVGGTCGTAGTENAKKEKTDAALDGTCGTEKTLKSDEKITSNSSISDLQSEKQQSPDMKSEESLTQDHVSGRDDHESKYQNLVFRKVIFDSPVVNPDPEKYKIGTYLVLTKQEAQELAAYNFSVEVSIAEFKAKVGEVAEEYIREYIKKRNENKTSIAPREPITEEEAAKLIDTLLGEGFQINPSKTGPSLDKIHFKITVVKPSNDAKLAILVAMMADNGFYTEGQSISELLFTRPLKEASS